jgi:hypothetical protein
VTNFVTLSLLSAGSIKNPMNTATCFKVHCELATGIATKQARGLDASARIVTAADFIPEEQLIR